MNKLFNFNNCIAFTVLCVFFVNITFTNADDSNNVEISNLNATCMRCLCEGSTGCNITRGCVEGYCGPFKISRIYWADAGKVIFEDDDIERKHAFTDCALNYYCASRMVKKYMEKFARDCNGDGITDCDDYIMINFNGGYSCTASLDANENSRAFQKRYSECKQKLF